MICHAILLLACHLLAGATPSAARAQSTTAGASNMRIIGHSDLKGVGKGGEGLALKQYPDGRRILYLAHESGPMCFSVVDVTRPEQPKVIVQLPVEADFVRCNSLGLAGDVLAVAHRTEKIGQDHAGLDVYWLIYANDRFAGGFYIIRYTGTMPLR